MFIFTSILRDETGKKLSKSLGNSPDPFDLFEEYGTDAVRFGIRRVVVFFQSKNSNDLIISFWPKENKDMIDEEVIKK